MAGERLAQYRLIGRLGAGGMGEVFLAEDTVLGRKVAIKVLAPAVTGNADLSARLLKEARAAAAVSHPAIAHVYEVGEAEGTRFIAMELVEGTPLDAELRQGLLAPERAVAIAREIADALAAAHRRGVIHRDVKPSNIMLTGRGVKVLDFGLAKLVPATGASLSDQLETELGTREGTILGTFPYMSPEQARGQAVDHRSDIFSLGVLLYEMLAGRRPFDGPTPNDTLSRILMAEPEPLDRLCPGIAPWLAAVVRRCLEKEYHRRFASAEDLAAALSAAVPTTATPQTGTPPAPATAPAQATPAPRRRQRWLALVATAGGLVALLASALLLFSSGRGARVPAAFRPIRSLAVLPFENRGPSADSDYLGDGLVEELINRLSALDGLTVISRASVFHYKGAPVDLKQLAKTLGVEGVLTGRLTPGGDRLEVSVELTDARDGRHVWGERYRRPVDDLRAVPAEMAATIARSLELRLSGAAAARLARRGTDDPEAHRLYLRGLAEYNRATDEAARRAVEHFQQAIARDPSFALAHAGLAAAWGMPLGDPGMRPNDTMPRALAAARRAIELDPELAEACTVLASGTFYYLWDPAEAEREFRRAIELNPGYALAHHQYGWMLALLGRYQESLAEFERAQTLDPLSLAILTDTNVPLALSGRFEEAIGRCKQAATVEPGFFLPHFAEGWIRIQQGELALAIAALERARSLDRSPMIRCWLGYAQARSGDREGALARLAELEAAASERYVSPFQFAIVHLGLGEREQALTWLERAYEERDGWNLWFRADRVLRELDGEPRWKELVRKLEAGGKLG